jgi:hypothetical protein
MGSEGTLQRLALLFSGFHIVRARWVVSSLPWLQLFFYDLCGEVNLRSCCLCQGVSYTH